MAVCHHVGTVAPAADHEAAGTAEPAPPQPRGTTPGTQRRPSCKAAGVANRCPGSSRPPITARRTCMRKPHAAGVDYVDHEQRQERSDDRCIDRVVDSAWTAAA